MWWFYIWEVHDKKSKQKMTRLENAFSFISFVYTVPMVYGTFNALMNGTVAIEDRTAKRWYILISVNYKLMNNLLQDKFESSNSNRTNLRNTNLPAPANACLCLHPSKNFVKHLNVASTSNFFVLRSSFSISSEEIAFVDDDINAQSELRYWVAEMNLFLMNMEKFLREIISKREMELFFLIVNIESDDAHQCKRLD